jgi:hypothetical protein
MIEYNFFADLLNKYSQLTPWVQVIAIFSICALFATALYFTKESIAIIAKIFIRNNQDSANE